MIAATPWLSHQWRRVLWPCVGLLVLFRMVSSNEPPLDVVIAIAVGHGHGLAGAARVRHRGLRPRGARAGGDAADGRATAAASSSSPAAAPLVYAVEMADAPPHGDAGAHGARPLREHARAALAVGAAADVGQRPALRHRAAAHRARGAGPAHGGRRRRPRGRPCGRIVASPPRLGRPARGPRRGRAPRGGGRASASRVRRRPPSNPRRVDGRPTTTQPLDRALVLDVWRQVAALHRDRIAHRNLDLERRVGHPRRPGGAARLRRRRHRRHRPRPGARPGPAAGVDRAGDGRPAAVDVAVEARRARPWS